MKYIINYFKKDGSQIQIGEDFTDVLIRKFATSEELIDFANSLGSDFGYSLLEEMQDGSFTSYVY